MNFKNLQFLFKPSYWNMNYPYNQQIDIFINYLLDNYEIESVDVGEYTVQIGGFTIWIANIPYASCRLRDHELSNYRPSRLTIKRFVDRFYKFREKYHKQIIYKEMLSRKISG